MGNGVFLELRPLWEATVALALGVLIGLEREHARVEAADLNPSAKGARTFALLALLGYASAEIGQAFPGMPLLVLAGIALLLAAMHLEKVRRPVSKPHSDGPP